MVEAVRPRQADLRLGPAHQHQHYLHHFPEFGQVVVQVGLQRVLVGRLLDNLDELGALDDGQLELGLLLSAGELLLDLRFEGAEDASLLVLEVVVLRLEAVLLVDELQDVLEQHLVLLVLPLLLEEVYFLVNVVEHCLGDLAVQAQRVHAHHVVLLPRLVLELLDHRRVRLDLPEGSRVLLELLLESGMLRREGRVVLGPFVLLELPLRLLVARLCLGVPFAVLFLHFFLGLHEGLVVADALVEGLGGEAASDPEREAGEAAEAREPEEIDLLVLLDLRHVEVLLLFGWLLALLGLLRRLFLFEDLVASAGLAGQHLLEHEFVRGRAADELDELGRFGVVLRVGLEVVLLDLLSLEGQLSNVAARERVLDLLRVALNRFRQVVFEQVNQILGLFDLLDEPRLLLLSALIRRFLVLN